MFHGPRGAALRRNNFHHTVRWADCVAAAVIPEWLRFHDLRHTGNTLVAASGASTRELMHRMGHASMRAAMFTSTLRASGTERSRPPWTTGSKARPGANGRIMAEPVAVRLRSRRRGIKEEPPTRSFAMERVTGIEPAWPAWKIGRSAVRLGEMLVD